MQAITIAIGKTGIQFFAQQYLVGAINHLLGQLTPPGRTIPISNFGWVESPDSQWAYSNISVVLANGTLQNFSPAFQSVAQSVSSDTPPVPIFTLNFQVNNFTANYGWTEDFNWVHHWKTWMHNIPIEHHASGTKSIPLSYSPTIGGLGVSVVVQFAFNSASNAWQVTVKSSSSQSPTDVQANIPSASILQHQDNSCAGQHVDAATAQMVSDIDFATPINNLISGILATIPGNGNLGNDIVYDFSLSAPDQLVFPNNDGIQIGVKGGASYQGTVFPGTPPTALPLPLPPADSDEHHLNMYVSNYEVDALNWAFYKADKLNAVINADQLPDPGVLKVKTYVDAIHALKPYQSFAMQAQIVLNAAPTTTFQTVYELTDAVMTLLKTQLPADQYNLLSGLQGNNYTAVADLESDLNGAGIAANDYPIIEAAAKGMGMVVTHDINFTLVIQNSQPTQPEIVFNVKRTDILGALALGVGPNQTQTMQFQFKNASWTATFISSTIPNFDGSSLATIWATAGEPRYDQLLTTLGATGTPIPIMQGMQFDFTNAKLSIQENYVSILASVLYTNS